MHACIGDGAGVRGQLEECRGPAKRLADGMARKLRLVGPVPRPLPLLPRGEVSYCFTEFGPSMTTFVMPSELYPVTTRATGHGISAGVGKLGAFIGVFLFPILNDSLGLRGTLLLTAGVAVLGFALTLVLPEPAGRSLEDMPVSPRETAAMPLRVADEPSTPRKSSSPRRTGAQRGCVHLHVG
jgi:hypothetical protein